MSQKSSYTPPLEPDMSRGSKKRSRSRIRYEPTIKRRRDCSRSVSHIHRYSHKRASRRSRIRARSRTRRDESEASSSDYARSLNTSKRHRVGRRRTRRSRSREYGRTLRSGSSLGGSSVATLSTHHNDSWNDTDSTRGSSLTYERRSRSRSRRKNKKSSRHQTSKYRRTRSPSSGDHEKNFFKKFCKFIDSKGNSFDGAHNVIPEFDPDANAQSATDWIRKVNETAAIYGWSEKQIIYHAIPKLAGYAKKWYQGKSSVNLSWRQWQRRILRTFPDDRNYADRLYEMLDRRSKKDESLEEYYHDKVRLVKMCGIRGRDAVDCIINGIFDNNIRLNAQGSSFKRPSQLLTFLRRISKRTMPSRKIYQGPKTASDGKDGSSRTSCDINRAGRSGGSSNNNRPRNPRCYNCSETGHTVSSCTKPIIRCDKCLRLGHKAHECRKSNSAAQQQATDKISVADDKVDTRRVLQISKDENQNGKYFKNIKLNGKDRSSYIDFGSQCTLISNKVALESGLILEKSGLPVIKGFGSGSVVPLGRTKVNIEVDAVVADVVAYIVPDGLISTDVLIGQSLTELPSVTAYKTSAELKLYCDETSLERIHVINSQNIMLEGLMDIQVHTDDVSYSGSLFIPGHTCMRDQNEYCILQGVYRFKDGKGRVLIISLCNKPIAFSENRIIARAIKLPKIELLNSETLEMFVNKITSESAPTSIQVDLKPITVDMLNVGPNVSADQTKQLLHLLNTYRSCFAFNMQELGLTNISEMAIRLNDDTPVTYKPYRLPFSERAIVRDMVGELLSNGIVRESQSAYASPIVLVRKKNNDYRLCVDYRALNKKTIKDSYPMPVIEDQLDRLSGKTMFTSLDLASGYYQIPVAESSRHVTAFVTPDGHYEYNRMPFGLVNAPAVFQNMINKALGNRRFDLAIPYLDDLLSTGSTFDEAFQKLEEILELLSKSGLTLNIKKCFFFQPEIDYLGYEISKSGLRPGSKKTKAVAEFPTPKNVHQVRQFVGLASFFRRFVFNFAALARPLTTLTKADIPWHWGPEQEEAFQTIKRQLIDRPILALYNPDYATEVHCEASKVGIGGVLLQRPPDETRVRPVAYYSRQTTREEAFWHSHELETMAVVLSLKKFRVYLIGLEFKVITDCNALRTTLTKRDLLPKVARWWLMLQEFNFTIEYRPGHNMQHVDALSRNPVPIEERDEIEILQIATDDWLHTVQMTDPRLKHIKTVLSTRPDDVKDITDNYVLRDNRLYRRVGRKLKWVVPNGARWRICQINHDESGHLSFDKTLEKISADYWFPKMRRFIKKFVTACINCAYNKEMSGKKTGYLHPIPKTPSIFHTMHMDHLGPFIKSKRGNTYILAVIDGFSKYIFIRAVRNTKSKTTINILEGIFNNFGYPKVLISDQGTSFTSSEFKSFVISLGIKHVLNAVATPRANGQIERYNRTILNSLAAMNHDMDEKDWDLNVLKLQWSLNNNVNKGIGKSPAEVVFGQRTSGESENILKGALLETDERDCVENVRKDVQNNIEKAQQKMKECFDKTRAPTQFFSVGDLVMIPNHNPEKGKSRKLAPKFRGPFKITTVLEKDRYEVSSIPGHSTKKYKNIYPADQLKPWITFQTSTKSDDDVISSSSSDGD